MNYRIESLMSARLFVVPQFAEERIYFLSNLSGHLSLYAMFYGGSVPEPLLPPNIALQNPHLIGGHSFYVFPALDKILVMIDRDGDENYQPMLIPLEGGYPQPAFNNFFAKYRVHLGQCDREKGIVYLMAERRDKPMTEAGLHPDLWKASCDMFGPYDLVTFSERIPETWKPYFKIAIGDPDNPKERADLIQRSPKTHLHNMKAPMLVIQGRNDPRVVAAESEDLVMQLRAKGRELELLIFEDEGHDVLKYENRVACYNAITDFFAKYLNP